MKVWRPLEGAGAEQASVLGIVGDAGRPVEAGSLDSARGASLCDGMSKFSNAHHYLALAWLTL